MTMADGSLVENSYEVSVSHCTEEPDSRGPPITLVFQTPKLCHKTLLAETLRTFLWGNEG